MAVRGGATLRNASGGITLNLCTDPSRQPNLKCRVMADNACANRETFTIAKNEESARHLNALIA